LSATHAHVVELRIELRDALRQNHPLAIQKRYANNVRFFT
jgi:hypothetical protein